MGAITETLPGDEMVCIRTFTARPRDRQNVIVPGTKTLFRVGDRVRFVSHYYKNTPSDNPTGVMVVFRSPDAGDENYYAATQQYFVSLDGWSDLEAFFSQRLAVTPVGVVIVGPDAGDYVILKVKRSDLGGVRQSSGSETVPKEAGKRRAGPKKSMQGGTS